MSFESLLPITCNIQVLSTTENAAGQHIDSWTNAATSVKCRLDMASGKVIAAPREVYESVTHVLFMLEQTGITLAAKTHRIVIDSVNYSIAAVDLVYGMNNVNHLEVALERIE